MGVVQFFIGHWEGKLTLVTTVAQKKTVSMFRHFMMFDS
jgi:hypothetical protein